MENQKWQLMRLFSSLLKNRAKEEKKIKQVSPELLKYFSRKELIAIITHVYDNTIPATLELINMENEDLLNVIADDMNIISYVTTKWSKEVPDATVPTSTEPVGKASRKEDSQIVDPLS